MPSPPCQAPCVHFEPSRARRRADTYSTPTQQPILISPSSSTPIARDYLPFKFGAEFEVVIQPKAITELDANLELPSRDGSFRKTRDFNLRLLKVVADLLSRFGMPCNVHDLCSDDPLDYSKWNATLDASVSKKHIRDGFYPMEIVSPVILADSNWPSIIDRFWATLSEHFDFRRDTSCGFHVHISPATGSYRISQLRNMAKAIIFWGPATARCAPPSRQDRILDFCKSNIRDVPCFEPLSTYGPLRGLQHAYEYVDSANRDAIVDYLCPDKYRAWNFKPSKVGGSGSIEHRRAPGVVTAKKAKHWIAFTMAFLDMAAQFSPESLVARVQAA